MVNFYFQFMLASLAFCLGVESSINFRRISWWRYEGISGIWFLLTRIFDVWVSWNLNSSAKFKKDVTWRLSKQSYFSKLLLPIFIFSPLMLHLRKLVFQAFVFTWGRHDMKNGEFVMERIWSIYFLAAAKINEKNAKFSRIFSSHSLWVQLWASKLIFPKR